MTMNRLKTAADTRKASRCNEHGIGLSLSPSLTLPAAEASRRKPIGKYRL